MLLETFRHSAHFILFEKLNDREKKKKREGEEWRIVFCFRKPEQIFRRE